MSPKKKEENASVNETADEVLGLEESTSEESEIIEEYIEPEQKKETKKAAKKTKKSDGSEKDKSIDFSEMFWGLGNNLNQTGIHALDIILGGGYEPGDWIELTGVSGTGKSTLVLDICRRAYAAGKKIAYLDVENGVKASLLKNLGVDPSEVGQRAGKDRFLLVSPQNFLELENVFKVIVSGDENNLYDIIVIDSLSYVTQFDTDLSVTSKDIALRARQEGVFFAEFKSELRRNKITVFVINQVTKKFVKRGREMVVDDDSTGGNKAKHGFDIRLWLDKGTQLRRSETTIMGSTFTPKGKTDDRTIYGCVSRLKAIKNRGERPEIPVDLHVIFGLGISNAMFVDAVLGYHEYYTSTTGGWEFTSIPALPCISEKKGKPIIDRQKLVSKNQAQIIEFLKSQDQWKLASGVDEDSQNTIMD